MGSPPSRSMCPSLRASKVVRSSSSDRFRWVLVTDVKREHHTLSKQLGWLDVELNVAILARDRSEASHGRRLPAASWLPAGRLLPLDQ